MKPKFKFSKKGETTEQAGVIDMTVLIAITVIFLVVGGAIAVVLPKAWKQNDCRLSVIANSKYRVKQFLLFGEEQEKIPINCPAMPDETIKYRDVKGKTSSTVALRYNIMDIVADDLYECHYRYAGDLNISPFRSNSGVYCGICKTINFDDKIQSFDFTNDGDINKGVIPKFYTYLLNFKIDKTKRYYSEFLFNYKKESDSINLFSNEFGLTGNDKNMDINIDTKKSYYVMHLVFKGGRELKNNKNWYFGESEVNGQKVADAKPTECGKYVQAISRTNKKDIGMGPYALDAINGASLISCEGSVSGFMWEDGEDNNKLPSYRVTTIIPVDEVDTIGCNVVYGLKKDDI